MLAPGRLVVVVERVRQRAIRERCRHRRQAQAVADHGTLGRTTVFAHQIDRVARRRLHAAGGEHHAERCRDSVFFAPATASVGRRSKRAPTAWSANSSHRSGRGRHGKASARAGGPHRVAPSLLSDRGGRPVASSVAAVSTPDARGAQVNSRAHWLRQAWGWPGAREWVVRGAYRGLQKCRLDFSVRVRKNASASVVFARRVRRSADNHANRCTAPWNFADHVMSSSPTRRRTATGDTRSRC